MAPCLSEHNVPLTWISASSSYFSQSILNTVFCVKMSNFCYKSNLIIHFLCLNSVAHTVLLESGIHFSSLSCPAGLSTVWLLLAVGLVACNPVTRALLFPIAPLAFPLKLHASSLGLRHSLLLPGMTLFSHYLVRSLDSNITFYRKGK